MYVISIIRNKTYSSKEASELLSMNINTFQRLAREGKIRIYKTGKNYRVTGAALLDYIGLPSTKGKKELIDDLNNSIENLLPILNKEGKSLSVFLHQSININADEETLERIIEDINRYITLSENKQ